MAESRDMLFLKVATKNNLIDSAQAEQILTSIEQRRELGVTRTPAEVALEKSFLTSQQVDAIESALRSTLPPERIAGFEIGDRIGRGAVGTVYRGRQVSLDKTVAVKVLHQNLTKHSKFVKQFIQEARSAARLNHPHVVHALDAGLDNGYNYFAMEFVEGHTLRDELKQNKQVPEERTLGVGLAVAQGLDHAHQNGILHRDLKPDNILLGRQGQIKIGDLGLAIPLDDAELLAEEHRRMGSPYYLSPEQAEGRTVDERSDLYALGATLYHCLLGKPVFTGANVAEIFTKQVHQTPVPLREAGATVSERTEELVMKLLEKDPDARYQSASEVAAEIQRLRMPSSEELGTPAPRPAGGARRGNGSAPTRRPTRATRAPGPQRGGGRKSGGRPRSEPIVAEREPRQFSSRRSNTWTLAGAGVGAVIAMILVLLAVSRNNERAQKEAVKSPEETLREELAERDLKRAKHRQKQWIEDNVTAPTERVKTALETFEGKAGGDTSFLLAGMWKTLRDNPTSPNAFALVERIAEIRDSTKNVAMERADESHFSRAQELRDQGKWWEAINLLDRLPRDLARDELVMNRADEMIAEMEAQIDAKYEEDLARVRKLRKDKQYERALEILDGIPKYADRELTNEAERIRADVADESERFNKQERDRALADEKKRYQAFAREYVALCQARDFKGAISKALEIDAELTTEAVKKSLEEDLEAFSLLDRFMKDFVAACEKGVGTAKLYKIVLKDKRKYNTGVARTTGDTIYLLIKQGGGTAQLPIEIEKITDESIFAIVEDYYNPSHPDYLIPMGVLYTYRGQGDVAREFFRRAAAAGADVDKWVAKIGQ